MAAPHRPYQPGHATSQTLHHAWRTAPNSAPHLLRHLSSLSPSPRLLDVGAGPGTLATSLASHLAPLHGHVTATDISDSVLARAAAHAKEQGVENISFRTASVYELPFKDGEFDVVHAHQVLCHLDGPVEAIREMLRVTKPGGLLALREADMKMWGFWPESEVLERFSALMARVMVANGGEDRAGRRLVEWVLQAGVERGAVEAGFGTWCFAEEGDRRVWGIAMVERLREGQVRGKGIELGLVTEEGVEEMVKAWEEWMGREEAVLGIVNGEVVVRKPDVRA
ncbi:methyltransferase [Staphylotrichum tortipilum]|uniref:Methyltransferase n=1 Tax=Staphylotrichum tortipilum TaxID=2831512 RepID=A0AAN6M9X3_9PEZI|nr:methyltransferase [Staphylotrichum longicolle]